MAFYTKTEISFLSPVQNLSGTLSLPSLRHTLSLPSHWQAGSLIGSGRKPTLGRRGLEKSGRISHSAGSDLTIGQIWDPARSEIRPDLALGQIWDPVGSHAALYSVSWRADLVTSVGPSDIRRPDPKPPTRWRQRKRDFRPTVLPKPRSGRKLTLAASVPLLRPRWPDLLVGLPPGWLGSWLAGVLDYQRCLNSTGMRRVFLSYAFNFVFDYFCIKLTWSLI